MKKKFQDVWTKLKIKLDSTENPGQKIVNKLKKQKTKNKRQKIVNKLKKQKTKDCKQAQRKLVKKVFLWNVSQLIFSMECFSADFCLFSNPNVKIYFFWVAVWVLAINYEIFKSFLKTF